LTKFYQLDILEAETREVKAMSGQIKSAFLALDVIAFVLQQFVNHPECRTEREVRDLSRELNLTDDLLHDMMVIAATRLGVGIYGWPLNGRNGKLVYPGASMELRNWMIYGTHRVWFKHPDCVEYITPSIDGPEGTIDLARQFSCSLRDPGLICELGNYMSLPDDTRRRAYDFVTSPRSMVT